MLLPHVPALAAVAVNGAAVPVAETAVAPLIRETYRTAPPSAKYALVLS
jgi:hypothetical protein